MRTILLILLVQLLVGCSQIYRMKAEQPRAVKGEIDLRNWDFEKDGPAWLKGEWYFIPGLLKPEDFDTQSLDKSRLGKVPGTRPNRGEAGVPWFGIGTWVLKIKLPPNYSGLYLRDFLGHFGSNTYVIESEVGQKIFRLRTESRVGGPETCEGNLTDRVISWPISGDSAYILWNVCSSERIAFEAPILGNNSSLLTMIASEWMERSTLLGAFLILAVSSFSLFLLRNKEMSYLYVSGVCCFMGIRYLGTDLFLPRLLNSDQANYHLYILNGAVSAVFTIASNIALIELIKTIELSKRTSIVLNTIEFAAIFLCVVMAAKSTNNNIRFFFNQHVDVPIWILGILIDFILIFYSLRLALSIKSWAVFLGIGVSAHLAGFIWDLVVGSMAYDLPYLMHYGNLILCICITLMTGKRFALTYSENERLLDEVKEKERARTTFFHNTSHELRTPLNGMIGFLQLAVQGRYGNVPDALQTQLQKCIRLSLGLKNQVNTILDLAKSKKGTLTLNNCMMKVDDLAFEAEDLAAGLMLKRQDSSFIIEKKWDPSEQQFVNDREKIGVLIRNLLGNAFKFSDPKRPNKVSLILERPPGFLRIVVSDTGIGIPPEQKDKVFEEFQ